ncbi:MAG: hypothetical protein RBR03_05010 [Desulfuromonas thiophila]|uniref:hypothetical protein n=1 Tax=Desulfuromonas thiophila TaxID=57664 RepID=UPI0024A8EBFD|nr:hypothetical protein [Desulfuromonas thiophila]MCK9172509.1 hypothetical protein [Desulfuromonas thiophila]MDY0397998.1 hypothetical protein [Desulfuromonas thiophila]
MQKVENKLSILMFMVFFLAFAGSTISMADETKEKQRFRLDAEVMYIVPEENLAVIAEKEIHLKWHIEKGIKVWDSRFVGEQENAIDLSTFKSRDRVLVTGSIKDGKIIADEIRLLQPAN